MRKRDWSLVLFTTLSQLSVGMILCLTALAYFNADTGVIFALGPSLKNPVIVAFVLVVVATTSSFLHLGNPSNAPRAMRNLAGSWLSREILALGVYSLSLLVILVVGWKSGGTEILNYLMLLSSMLGLALLWMMIRIYTVPTIPAWNSWYTPLSFFSTAICLGLITTVVLSRAGLVDTADQILKKFMLTLTAILLIEVVTGYLNQRRLETMNTGIENLVFDRGLFYRVFLGRMVILIIAIVAVLLDTLGAGNGFYNWGLPLVILTFTQEIMGRFLFYASYFRTGV